MRNIFWNQLILNKNNYFKYININKNAFSILHAKLHQSELVKLYENSFTVQPRYGKLLLKSKCHCNIQSTCLQSHPDANIATVILWGKNSENCKIEAELLEKNELLKLEILPSSIETNCEIYIPMKYDIEADMEDDANLGIKDIENDRIDISMQKGSISTKNIKTEEFLVAMDSGTIKLDGAFQGNIHLNGKNVMLKAKRLQGMELFIQADNLDTEIESSYMLKGTIFAKTGNINMKHLHGSTNLHLFKGNLFVNGLHGQLQALVNDGNVDIQVSQLIEDSLIQLQEGSLALSFTELSNKSLNISAPQIDIHPDVKQYGSESETEGVLNFNTTLQESPSLFANVAKGTIRMYIKDWFSSLGIKTN